MKKVLIGLGLLTSIGFAGGDKEIEKTQENSADTYIKQMLEKQDISSFIGMKIDSMITVTKIYQDSKDKTNIVYEYTYDLSNQNIDKSKYNEIATSLWEKYLPMMCATPELKTMFKMGAGARYIYTDHNKALIGDMVIKEKDCQISKVNISKL